MKERSLKSAKLIPILREVAHWIRTLKFSEPTLQEIAYALRGVERNGLPLTLWLDRMSQSGELNDPTRYDDKLRARIGSDLSLIFRRLEQEESGPSRTLKFR